MCVFRPRLLSPRLEPPMYFYRRRKRTFRVRLALCLLRDASFMFFSLLLAWRALQRFLLLLSSKRKKTKKLEKPKEENKKKATAVYRWRLEPMARRCFTLYTTPSASGSRRRASSLSFGPQTLLECRMFRF